MTGEGARLAAGFVLAGGRSSRMGRDKALVEFRGRPLIELAVSTLRAAGLDVRIAGSRSALDLYGEAVIDGFTDAGPLGGVEAALRDSRAEWNVFLPVDMPLMPTGLIEILVERARLTGVAVTLASLRGKLEPFPVVLNQDALGLIVERLKGGLAGCQSAWRALGEIGGMDLVAVEALVQCGRCVHEEGWPAHWWFEGANTPGELGWMEKQLLTTSR